MLYAMCNVGIMIYKFHLKDKIENTSISEKNKLFQAHYLK